MHERGHVLAIGRYRREPASVPQARKAAVQAYAPYSWIDGSLVALLVSEAVTNAVLHADGPDLFLLCHSPSPVDGSVQVEVHDRSATPPRHRTAAERDEHGRGLALLDHLATTWRTERTAAGKSLIFTLDADTCPSP